MYQAHFNLSEYPFGLTPNTRFHWNGPSQHELWRALVYALEQGEGFIKVSGEVGSGKSLLCRRLLNELPDHYHTAFIPMPNLGPDALLLALAQELGLKVDRKKGRHNCLALISDFLINKAAHKQHVLLLIDEAQAMPQNTLEALRLLSNLESEQDKLLQIVLFGQPELDTILKQYSMRQLQQRITLHLDLQSFDHQDCFNYLNFRLLRAGYNGPSLFSDGNAQKLNKAARGLPRVINILAHKAMMISFSEGKNCIEGKHIRAAISDSPQCLQNSVTTQNFLSLLLLAVVLLTSGLFFR